MCDLILNLHDGYGFIENNMKMQSLIQMLGDKQLSLTRKKINGLW